MLHLRDRVFAFVAFVFAFSEIQASRYFIHYRNGVKYPLVLSTWNFGYDAARVAWYATSVLKLGAVDALVEGQTYCELKPCSTSVGFGGNPDESGEPSLDALIMDGVSHQAAAVANLRRIKNAIGVARKIMLYTKHTLLAGEQATKFAVSMGFKEESLITNTTREMWKYWINHHCQPNFWKNVVPDPSTSCGPYHPLDEDRFEIDDDDSDLPKYVNEENHDTIGMVVIDSKGQIAAGTTTNGLYFKIPGRVGDSPIPGSGAYADQEVGAAAATGDGDIMMRFVPSYQTVENMRQGMNPTDAAKDAILRIAKKYPDFEGALIAANIYGEYGAACHGMKNFTFNVGNPQIGKTVPATIRC